MTIAAFTLARGKSLQHQVSEAEWEARVDLAAELDKARENISDLQGKTARYSELLTMFHANLLISRGQAEPVRDTCERHLGGEEEGRRGE